MTQRLENFLGKSFASIYNPTTHMKAGDFKPIIPALYPEMFEAAEWIGWIDIDVIISNDF